MEAEEFCVRKKEKCIHILTVNRKLANQLYIIEGNRLIFTNQALLEDDESIRLETVQADNMVLCYPADGLKGCLGKSQGVDLYSGVLGAYRFDTEEWRPKEGEDVIVHQVGMGRYTVSFPDNLLNGLKDMRLQLEYTGDIGHAFIENTLVNDNFANGATWEIGLKDFAGKLRKNIMTIYITPLREEANVNVESAMAGRFEDSKGQTAELYKVGLCPVYEIMLLQKSRLSDRLSEEGE